MMQELSLNILDIAENSVRAGASVVGVTVDVRTVDDRMDVIISDDGRGMTEEMLVKVTDPFFTTRTTRNVGLGVPFFKMAAELTGGSFNIMSTPGEGTTVTARFVMSSIDCMPLGDINASIFTLIQCNPEIDFVYTRRYNGAEMMLDTRQFREILDGIPLSSPEVLAYIRNCLDENTAELLNSVS